MAAAAYSRMYAGLQIFGRSRLQAWGRFVATRQLTVLLLCCVFLCTLTYPVLSLYAWAAPSTTSDFFSFLRTSPTWNLVGADGSIARARDLKLPWQDLDALIVNGEEACWQRIPKFREITVQQLLLGFPGEGGGVASEHGVLDRRALHSVHKLEQKLQQELYAGRSSIRCAKLENTTTLDTTERCFTLSPMAYWDNSENMMLSDTSLIATVNSAQKLYGLLPLRQEDLFVGRVYAGTTMRKADYAVVTLFLQEAPEPSQVTKLVAPLATEYGLTLVESSKSDSRAVLKHRSDVRIRQDAWEDFFFFAGYAVVGFYVYWTLRGLDKVHSKSGLVITGMVQMLVSGMLSLSLCALAGYKISLIPWKLIPFLILVLGVDNMFVLTMAVSATSINMPVKERIAEGLGKSGLSILLNLVAELITLWIFYIGIPSRVIREMVVFGGTALVVDYIMEMTFFITVLSIDMQRLELADFLSQGSHDSMSSPKHNGSMQGNQSRVPGSIGNLFGLVREHRARTWSAIILIGSNYLLYLLFGPEYFVPAFCSNLDFTEGPRLDRAPGAPLPASEAFWQLLGARSTEAVHVHVSTPTVLLFDTNHSTAHRGSSFTQVSIYACFKYMVVPISITTFALYLFLTQLLKGSERLSENSRPTIRIKDTDEEEVPSLLPCLTLQPYRAADVEVLASTTDGLATASWVPAEQCIQILQSSESSTPIQLSLVGLLQPGEVVTHLAIDDKIALCACSTSLNRFLAWPVLAKATPIDFQARSPVPPSRTVALFPESLVKSDGSPPRAGSGQSSLAKTKCAFLTAHKDGSVMRWDCARKHNTTVMSSLDRPCRVAVLHAPTMSRPLLARVVEASQVEVWRSTGGDYGIYRILDLEEGGGTVTAQSICIVGERILLALGKASGVVDVWDLQERVQIYTGSIHAKPVQRVRLVSIAGTRCGTCNIEFSDGAVLASGTTVELVSTRLLSNRSAPCDCDGNSSPTVSRSPSGNPFVRGGSPVLRRVPSPRISSEDSNKTLSYPLSPHGLRRLSQASERKKFEDPFHKPMNGTETSFARSPDGITLLFDHSRETSEARSEANQGSPVSASIPWRAQKLGRMDLDVKGAWDVLGQQVVGVRRNQQPANRGLLARWETWAARMDRPTRDVDKGLASHGFALDILLAASTSESEAQNHEQLPFDRIRHFRTTRDGQKLTATLGNLVILSTPGGLPKVKRTTSANGFPS